MHYWVKHNCVLFYGSSNHASITLSVGQIWRYRSKPSEDYPFHILTRKNVLIEITDEDFKRIFKPQGESE
jgi:hypothetical protein